MESVRLFSLRTGATVGMLDEDNAGLLFLIRTGVTAGSTAPHEDRGGCRPLE